MKIVQRGARPANGLGLSHHVKPVRARIRTSVEGVARSMGYVFTPLWRLQSYELAEHLKALFGALGVDCVLDVGANRGQYRDFLRAQIGYRGPIVSFEPISENVRVLTHRAAGDERWTIIATALGREDCTAEINVTAATVLSSFLRPKKTPLPELADLSRVERTEMVQVKRLDSIFQDVPAAHAAKNIFLKIDTQGYELDILEGARDSLKWTRGLQSEVSVIPLYHGIRDYLECIAYMQNLGFCITGMFPVNRDSLLRVIDFDCVMRRTESDLRQDTAQNPFLTGHEMQNALSQADRNDAQ
jgi:FkbM family methyltransferase